MNLVLTIVCVLVLLLVVLNVMEENKIGSILEIYEYDYHNHFELQRIVCKKQPVLFQLQGIVLADSHQLHTLSLESYQQKYGKETVKIRSPIKPIPSRLRFEKALELIRNDTDIVYLSNENNDFAQDTSFEQYIASLDEHLQPSFTLGKERDVIFGSPLACTPLQYHIAHSSYLYVAQGAITIKMTPWKNTKWLPPGSLPTSSPTVFASPNADLWNDPALLENVSCLEFPVPSGWALYIPPYWWYTIRLHDLRPPVQTDATPEWDPSKRTLVVSTQYTTWMNTLVKSPQLLQRKARDFGWLDGISHTPPVRPLETAVQNQIQEPVFEEIGNKEEEVAKIIPV